jgi:Mn2+/Fe2+ NRAMP family transporter
MENKAPEPPLCRPLSSRGEAGRGTMPAFWRRFLWVAGPGLVAMLADTDAGSVITVAQSGAQWGYRLLLPNLLLIPLMFCAQELALRLGLGTGQGVSELVRRRIGRRTALLVLAALVASGFGALVSEMSGLAGVGAVLGLPVPVTVAVAVAGLALVVGTGSYRSVERIALFLGLSELAFVVMAWKAHPDLGQILREAGRLPLHQRGYLALLAANLGTSIIPWALFYQQLASVDKGLRRAQIRAARVETLIGVVLCQGITSALLIAAGATLGGAGPLQTVAEIETAFTATLGGAAGRVIFVCGLSGGALVASIVVCLTLAWAFGEVLGVRHWLEHRPGQAPWFYRSMVVMLVAAGGLVASGISLVRLAVAAGVANALLLPATLGLLAYLARTALPPGLRLGGAYGLAVGAALLGVGAVGLVAGLAGALG